LVAGEVTSALSARVLQIPTATAKTAAAGRGNIDWMQKNRVNTGKRL
jgi:hypothetical protein